jgi:zinc protease
MKTSLSFKNVLTSVSKGLALGLTVVSIASCSSSPKKSGGIFGSSEAKSGYKIRDFEEKTLSNGLRVLFIPDKTLPYVSYSLLVRTGSVSDPVGQEGLASLVADLLNKGTSKRSATQIADELGRMGAEFDASASYDYSVVTASGLSPQAEALLNNLVEIVTMPSFPEAEFKRSVAQAQSQIARLVDSPDAYADLAFASYLYGSHPYGRPTIGTAKSIAALKKRNVIQAYLRTYRPNNAILAVVGQYTPELQAKIEQSFGAWEKRDLPDAKPTEVSKIEGLGIRVIDYPSLVQSQIRIGQLGIDRKDPRFLPLRLGNTILGGAFASRLNDRIRKDLGLTYGINSTFDARMERGPFVVETFTKNASVGQAVTESLKVLEQFKEQGATSEEIERSKGYLKGIFPAAIETPEKLALNLLLLRHYGIPDSYLTNYLRDIDALSRGEVNRAMSEALDTKNIRILVYSKASDVVPQLEPIVGQGKVEVLEAVKK